MHANSFGIKVTIVTSSYLMVKKFTLENRGTKLRCLCFRISIVLRSFFAFDLFEKSFQVFSVPFSSSLIFESMEYFFLQFFFLSPFKK